MKTDRNEKNYWFKNTRERKIKNIIIGQSRKTSCPYCCRTKIIGKGFSLNNKFVFCENELTLVCVQQIKKCTCQAPSILISFQKHFFLKFELPNLGCGLSADVYGTCIWIKWSTHVVLAYPSFIP